MTPGILILVWSSIIILQTHTSMRQGTWVPDWLFVTVQIGILLAAACEVGHAESNEGDLRLTRWLAAILLSAYWISAAFICLRR